MMALRERVEKAFRFEEVQPTPYTIWYDEPSMEKLNAHYGRTKWQDRIENHIFRISVDWEPKTDIGDERYTDIHGTIWQRGKPAHIVEPVLREPTMAGFEIPDYVPFVRAAQTPPGGEHAILPMLGFEDAREQLQAQKDRTFNVVGYGFGFFEGAWMIRGYENFFMDLVSEQAFAEEMLDALLERHLALLGPLLELPCDGIIFSDDYGDQRGVIIGPDLWRKFVKPRLAKLYAKVHDAGKMALQHTCGSVFDIIPDLIDCGLDVLQSLQPEAMPVYEIKKRYGDRLRLWGGLGTQRLLPLGTPDEIRAEVRRLRSELGAGGGYCFTSSKPIMEEVPVENAVALIEEVVQGGI